MLKIQMKGLMIPSWRADRERKAKSAGGVPRTSQSLDSMGLLGKWLIKDEASSQTQVATKHVNKR